MATHRWTSSRWFGGGAAARYRLLGRIAALALLWWRGCTATPGSNGSDPVNTPAEGTVSMLDGPRFVAAGGNTVLTFRRDETFTGNVKPAMILKGAATQLFEIRGIAVNAANELLVVTGQGNASQPDVVINVYADATRLNGNQAPIRQITGTGIPRLRVASVAMDVDRDLLYILHKPVTGNETFVSVYEDTAMPGFDGELAPPRQFTNSETKFRNITQMFVAPGGALYIGGDGDFASSNGLVYESPGSLSDSVNPDRVFGVDGSVVDSFAIDAEDTLYALVRNGNEGTILQVPNASTLDGAVPEVARIDILGSLFASDLVLDSSGSAYYTSLVNILAYDDVVELDGPLEPTRTIEGDMTQLTSTINGAAHFLVLD